MTIKNIADKIINDALNSEQYFQCLINEVVNHKR